MSGGAAFAGISMAGALLGGLAQGSAYDAQARNDTTNAQLSILGGEQQVVQTLHEERQTSGAAIAALAESGGTVGTGTAADLIRQNALQREIEIGNLRAQAQGQARNYQQKAADERYAGTQARIGGVFSALSAGLQYDMQRQDQKRLDSARAAEWAARLPTPRTDIGAPAPVPGGTYNPAAPYAARPSYYDVFQPRPRFGVLGLP